MPKGPSPSSQPEPIIPYHILGKDPQGHTNRLQSLNFIPWLVDLFQVLATEIPVYNGTMAAVVRDCAAIGARKRIDEINDPTKRAEAERIFQLHADIQAQYWEQQQFSQMQKYVESSESTLRLHADAGNWMLVTSNLERMKKRLEQGSLWEPHATTVREMIARYEKLLRDARPK